MAEWETEHFPEEDFTVAPVIPSEIADQLSPQARQSLVDEAKRVYRDAEDWTLRRSRFLRRLDSLERVWFA
jgi:hypothetical protein